MTPAVVFDDVSKKFRRGERHDSLRDLLPALVRRAVHPRAPDALASEEFWALRNVSFELHTGQALGIIGPNGAGKSTALKLLTKLLKPTTGHCAVRGRVGALIEVAAGFHPDLTGRENVYLQGAIMGMRRADIAARFDDIVDFAGVAAFIDTPVKRYSSGMNARLGFSIAAHLDPEVLIIDEVLSVGDLAFQQRCIERMNQFKRAGVTIVFVSHNLQAVRALCDHALFLHNSVRAFGHSGDVIEQYVRALHATDASSATQSSQEFEVALIRLEDERHLVPDAIAPGTALTLRASWRVLRTLSDITLGFIVYRSTDGFLAFGGNVSDVELGLTTVHAHSLLEVTFRFRAHLCRGQYHLECFIFENSSQTFLTRICPAGLFRVEENRTNHGSSIADVELECSAVQRDLQHAGPFADDRPQEVGS